MLAAIQLEMCMLDDSKVVADAQYRNMQSNNLLSAAEIAALKGFDGFRPFLPLVWALEEAKAKLKPDAAVEFLSLRDQAYKLRGHLGQIVNLLEQPVPFPYFHVLKVLLIICLLVLSYALVELLNGQPFFSVLVFGIISSIMVGLEEVAVAMSDPFGDDDIDFDTDEIARKAYNSTIALLRDSTPLQKNSLSDDVGNPVTEQLPASPPEGTTLAALMAVGASIDGFDWAAYTMDEEARTYKNSLTSTPGMVAIVVNAARKSFAGGALARRRSSATVEDRLSQQLGSGAAPPPPTCLPPPSGRANGSGGYRLLTEDKNGPMAV
mmetsp:Transcript_11476/g.30264  ORF Transcript_11476/g.30264 Transcript_11476/m.30264 type:complete len:322 (+) Transcript_11476:248-1213(+)